MQELEAMRSRLREVVEREPERGRADARAQAEALVPRLHLVHRSAGGPTLAGILAARCLSARQPCTPREQDCGIARALYFFLGCAAYPEGSVAFVVPNRVLQTKPASFSPFDTGSLETHSCPRDTTRSWQAGDKHNFLAEHLGEGADAVEFAVDYVAAHFEQAADYVRRPRLSVPDFPTYHGLDCRNGDRRTWSIEVQMHEDFDLDARGLEAIVLGQPDLLVDISDDLVEKVVVVEDEGSIAPTIHRLIAGQASS